MKLYDEIKWSGYDWYIIGINDDSYKLLMKETLKNEDYLDDDNEMKFGETNIWRDSFIRNKLNTEFIEKLNKDDMLEMTTKIRDDEEIIETTDYIRLLSINEILDDLPMRIRQCDNWYWSLSPRAYSSCSSFVFYVNTPGYVAYTYAIYTGSVRPVVLIDKSALEKCNQEYEVFKEDIEKLDIEGNAINRAERYIKKSDSKNITLSLADYVLANKINEIIEVINENR